MAKGQNGQFETEMPYGFFSEQSNKAWIIKVFLCRSKSQFKFMKGGNSKKNIRKSMI